MQRCRERLATSRQSLLDRFRWNVESSSDQMGSARTTVIRDLVINEWKVFKQENSQQLRTDGAAHVNILCSVLFAVLTA